MRGTLALVGSGEYLPAMAEFEKSLIKDGEANGHRPRYIQIPTAAGQESAERIEFWKELGATQAERLDATFPRHSSIHLCGKQFLRIGMKVVRWRDVALVQW
jgi:hypothetical protein